MKIAVRDEKDGEGKWKEIPGSEEQQSYEAIQELIYDIPELISLDGLASGRSSLRVCVRNNSKDDSSLIGIDENGTITVVECKIVDGSSARREVVGRALEYAANLWEMSYETFDSMVLESEGRSLAEIMKEKLQADDWSEEKFRNTITSALQNGKFRLVVTVQELTTELKQMIKFLNARGFETYVLEMHYFSDGQIDIAVPRVTGSSELDLGAEDSAERVNGAGKVRQPQTVSTEEPALGASEQSVSSPGSSEPPVAEPKKAKAHTEPEIAQVSEKGEQKEDLFFAKCKENAGENALEMIKRLYDFSKNAADHIVWWGSGGAGAFNFVLTQDDLTVFIVDSSGKMMFNFSDWQKDPSYRDLLPQFLEKLKGITVLQKQKGDYTRWPDFKVEEFLAGEDDFAKFEESIGFLKEGLSKVTPL